MSVDAALDADRARIYLSKLDANECTTNKDGGALDLNRAPVLIAVCLKNSCHRQARYREPRVC